MADKVENFGMGTDPDRTIGRNIDIVGQRVDRNGIAQHQLTGLGVAVEDPDRPAGDFSGIDRLAVFRHIHPVGVAHMLGHDARALAIEIAQIGARQTQHIFQHPAQLGARAMIIGIIKGLRPDGDEIVGADE